VERFGQPHLSLEYIRVHSLLVSALFLGGKRGVRTGLFVDYFQHGIPVRLFGVAAL